MSESVKWDAEAMARRLLSNYLNAGDFDEHEALITQALTDAYKKGLADGASLEREAPESFKDYWRRRLELVRYWEAKSEELRHMTTWFHGADWAIRARTLTMKEQAEHNEAFMKVFNEQSARTGQGEKV